MVESIRSYVNGQSQAPRDGHFLPQRGYTESRENSERTEGVERTETVPLPGNSSRSPCSPCSPCSQYATSQVGNSEHIRRLIFRYARRLRTEGREPADRDIGELFKTNAALGIGFDEFRGLVLDALDRVKKPVGAGDLAEALAEADKRPTPEYAARYVAPELRRVLSLCQVLQNRTGAAPFFLAGASLADELGVAVQTVHQWLRLLVRDGVLEIIVKGSPGRATRYRLSRWPTAPLVFEDDGPYQGDRP